MELLVLFCELVRISCAQKGLGQQSVSGYDVEALARRCKVQKSSLLLLRKTGLFIGDL